MENGQGNNIQNTLMPYLQSARRAAQRLAQMTTEQKNSGLRSIASSLIQHQDTILMANQKDLETAAREGMPVSRLDRLALDERRLLTVAEGVLAIADLQDPVGEVIESITRPNGLTLQKVRVPFGVVAIIFESRPNVTVDAASLTFKTGNAAILRGGREALQTNQALMAALTDGLRKAELPDESVLLITQPERELVDVLIRARHQVDLVIPRGGAGLIERVMTNATVPVIETGVGNCHVFVDVTANLDMAEAIVINAKTQRPSVCNAIESLLLHEDLPVAWIAHLFARLRDKGVTLRVCETTRQRLDATERCHVQPASEEDLATESLDLTLAVKTVHHTDEAKAHIEQYGTRHSEAIITEDSHHAEQFLQQVDAAAVYHNASTRFTDGFEFGFGAEIGISTQKLHARGPMGLRELTTYKYRIYGQGQIRP